MVIRSLNPGFDPDDPLGPIAPVIRPFFPEPEPMSEGDDRDGGDYDQDEYGPLYDELKIAA